MNSRFQAHLKDTSNSDASGSAVTGILLHYIKTCGNLFDAIGLSLNSNEGKGLPVSKLPYLGGAHGFQPKFYRLRHLGHAFIHTGYCYYVPIWDEAAANDVIQLLRGLVGVEDDGKTHGAAVRVYCNEVEASVMAGFIEVQWDQEAV